MSHQIKCLYKKERVRKQWTGLLKYLNSRHGTAKKHTSIRSIPTVLVATSLYLVLITSRWIAFGKLAQVIQLLGYNTV